MKKYFGQMLFLAAAAAVLLLASCQRDELQGGSISGEEVSVSISATMPIDGGAVVKSNDEPGNASYVNRCIMGVYLNDDGMSQPEPMGDKVVVRVDGTTHKAEFGDLQLVSGHKYLLVFWADNATEDSDNGFEDNHYNTADFPEVTFKEGDTYQSNDDTRDAFFASYQLEVNGPSSHDIELHRPFGQLNITTNDYRTVAEDFASLLPTQVKIDFSGIDIPTGIDLLTGELTEDKESSLVSGPVKIASVTLPIAADGCRQLSFDYIFAPYEEEGKEQQLVLNDFTMHFMNDEGQKTPSEYIFQNIPVRRNYRTNVSGNLLTDRTGIDVEVVPDFNEPDMDKDAELMKLLAAIENGGEYTLQDDIEITEPLVIDGESKTVTVKLNGFDIINTTSVPDTDPRYGNTTVFQVSGSSVLNIEGEGNVHAISSEPNQDGYRMAVYALGNAKVNINGGNFFNDQDFNNHGAQLDLIYADQNAVINIYGGRFESGSSNSSGYWVLNLKDGSKAAINVYGGTFVNFDPSSSMTENPVKNFVADGCSTVKVSDEPDPNGTYVVVKDGEHLNVPVEAGTPETFVQALASAAVAEISVEADMNLSTVTTEELTFTQHKTIDIASGTTIKLGDQNHFTAENGLTLTGGGIIDNSTDTPNETNPGYQKSLIHITGGDLIIDGITLVNDPDHHWHGTQYNSAAIAYWNDANVTITNAHIKSGEFTVCGMGRGVASGEITISDSYFESTSTNKNNGKHYAYAMRLFGSKIRLDNCEVKGVQGGVSIEGCKDAEIISGKYYTVNTPGNIDGYYPLYVTNDAVVVVSGGKFSAANNRSGGLDIGGTSAVVSDDNDVNLPYGCVILKGGKFSGKAYNDVTREVYQPAEGYVYKETGDDEYPWEVVTE